jgi:peptide/nickel transport system permease protein
MTRSSCLSVSPRGKGMARAGVTALGLLACLALSGMLWSPHPPGAMAGPSLSPPSPSHLLGTNGLGQDVLSQLLSGCAVSLLVGLSVGSGATLLGFVIGSAAGYYPGRLGPVLMRGVDALMVIPRLPLIILLAVLLRPRLVNVLAVLILLSWPGVARTIRAQVLSIRERDAIRFVRFSGGGFAYVLRHHLWRELLPLLLAKAAATASHAIVAEAGLSFLGLGDPALKSWGTMIRSALDYPGIFWTPAWSWWLLPPSILVSLAVLSFTLMGYALESCMRRMEGA